MYIIIIPKENKRHVLVHTACTIIIIVSDLYDFQKEHVAMLAIHVEELFCLYANF